MRTSLKVGVVAAFAFVASATAQAGLNLPAMQCSYSFSSDMGLGARSTSVMDLQKVLNMYPETKVASTGAGSPGMETSYFGPATRAAVLKFQSLHLQDTRATGFVGPLTRALLNQVCTGGSVTLPAGCTSTVGFSPLTGQSCSSGTTNPGPVVTGPISVMAASVQPNTILVAGQSAANLGEFVFTGNGTITSLELKRLGVSSNDTIVNAYLYEGATRLTDASSVLTNGTVKFNNALVVNGSRTLSVRGDIKTGTGGQVVGVAVSGITVSGGTAMPVLGANSGLQTIANATMATGNFTTAMPSPSATSINAGSMNQNLWSNTLSVGTRSVMLKSFTVKMVGSAPANTLANVGLFVNGTKVSSATIDANNRFVFNLMSAPVTLNTGSQLIEVRGDVVAGANRNFYVVLEQATDILVEDSQLPGAFLTVTNSAAQLLNMQAGLVTVNNGTLTISQDTTFNNVTTVVGGSTNAKLASFKVTSYGEDVKVNSLTFTPNFAGLNGGSNNLANVGLYINGGQVASSQTATNATSLMFTNLGSNLIATAGTPVIIEIRGDLVTATGTNHTAGTVQFNLLTGSSNAQGVQSSQLTNTPASSGQTLTVSSSNLTVSNTTGFAASTKAPNAQQAKIGSFTVQTASAEGVTITNLSVGLDGTLLSGNHLTNITVKDGSTVVGTPIGNPTANNNFSANVVVPPSSTKVLEVFADLGSNSAGATTTPTMTVTARGSVSNITTTPGAATGVMTTAAVTVIGVNDITFVPASSPVAQYVIGGTSSLGIATFNIKTAVGNNVGGGVIRDVTFTAPVNTISSVTMNGKTANMVAGTAIIYDANITVPADNSGINVPVTASLVCTAIGSGCAGASSSSTSLTMSNVTYNNGSAVVPVVPAAAVSATHTLVATKPTITMNSSTQTGFGNGTLQIGTFTIAADAAGDVKLQQIRVNTTVAGAGSITAGSVELRDSDGTTVITGVAPVNGGVADFVFSTPRTITKGTSGTFTVFANFTGVTGDAGSQSATFSLGDKAQFLWTDVAGNAVGLTGTPINAYPTNSQTRTN